jgi:hypothetical protein
MAAGMFFPRPVRHWRDAVMKFDLGRRTELRPFLNLTLDEQAFVVARIAWRRFKGAEK